jgi:hypothetical protein
MDGLNKTNANLEYDNANLKIKLSELNDNLNFVLNDKQHLQSN